MSAPAARLPFPNLRYHTTARLLCQSPPRPSAWHGLCKEQRDRTQEEHDVDNRLAGAFVRNAYIKFHSDAEYQQVCEALVAHSPVSRLSNGVFCVPWNTLALLDTSNIGYSFATEADLASAQPIWNFAAPRPR